MWPDSYLLKPEDLEHDRKWAQISRNKCQNHSRADYLAPESIFPHFFSEIINTECVNQVHKTKMGLTSLVIRKGSIVKWINRY